MEDQDLRFTLAGLIQSSIRSKCRETVANLQKLAIYRGFFGILPQDARFVVVKHSDRFLTTGYEPPDGS